MRILMLSDTERQGGAGIAASRLAEGLAANGYEVVRVVRDAQPGADPTGPWERIIHAPPAMDWDQVPDDAARQRVLSELRELFHSVRPDAINIHNIHGGLKHGLSEAVARIASDRVPTIWTLHDMWSFTGRCAFDSGCGRFAELCDANCSSWQDYPRHARERIAEAHAAKRDIIGSCGNLLAVVPSRWMARQAVRGGWPAKRVHVIPNGLDLNRYAPGDKLAAREVLGVRSREPVLLAVAQHLGDPRKGMDLLADALGQEGFSPCTLLFMGASPPDLHLENVRVVSLGTLSGQAKVTAYQAADVYVHPAREDNLPNTVVEALAVGVPCVAFEVGGLPDLVVPGVSGRLATEVTGAGLGRAMEQLFEDFGSDGQERMQLACRRQASAEHDQTVQARRYAELFRSMAARGRSG